MFKLMIVDDERLIREGLTKGFKWAEMGFELVAAAADGKEALKKFEELKPQVILMDIKMPGLTGLEVLKEIKEEDAAVEVVLLSGYDDFLYAKEGIRLGAFDYIQKINLTVELEDAFSRLRKKLEKNLQAEQEYFNLLNIKNNHLFLQFLQGEAKEFTLNPSKKYLFCAAVIYTESKLSTIESSKRFSSRIQFIMGYKGNYHIIIFWANNSTQAFECILNNTAKELYDYIKNEHRCELIIGIGSIKSDISCIPVSYYEAMKSVDLAMAKNEKGIKVYVSEKYEESRQLKHIHRNITDDIQLRNYSNVIKKTSETFKIYFENPELLIPDIRFFCTDLLIQIKNIAEAQDINIHDEVIKYIKKVESTDSFLDLEQWFMSILCKIFDVLKEGFLERRYNSIQQAKLYVDENYLKDISMEDVAKLFFMSASHFSVKFKELTGKTFSRYMIEKRIEKSCILLSNTELKVYEIAYEVGYKDEKHFIKLFTSLMHISPRKFRLENSVEKNAQ